MNNNRKKIKIKFWNETKDNYIETNIVLDEYYEKWIKELFNFILKIKSERKKYCIQSLFCLEYSFFEQAEATTAQFLYFLTKDEISQMTGNNTLELLCDYASNSDENLRKKLLEYLTKLCRYKFNDIFVAHFFDFFIGIWSNFEAAVTSICFLFEEQFQEKINNSNFKKMCKFLNKHFENKEIIDEFKKKKIEFQNSFPKYLSFSDKINLLFKDVLSKSSYSREIKKDKEIIEFCIKSRNTIHNNGINHTDSSELEINGEKIILNKNEPAYYKSFFSMITLVNEIFDIYLEILNSFQDKQNNRLNQSKEK
ncbi:hypothetical protein [uncultured Leptotrichia sp.]|uniref:hypothetical protein n=1 Tax=uncultured Leptotrichia sp. TaxID=159271 RepID=UPI00260B1D5E|nr:hypothetical protein [uncultured Leptotrichia sp.]